MEVQMNMQKAQMMMWFCVFLLALSISMASKQIDFLPGFPTKLPFKLETGYIGVEEGEDVQLFYYFVESERKPEEDPLLLWQCGGPGCSPFMAFAYQSGPLSFDYKSSVQGLPNLILNPHSWTKFANIIFFDQPIGTGFSYSKSGHYKTDTWESANRTYSFLRKWFNEHPKFVKNSFYLVGDSFGGALSAAAIHEILNGNKRGDEPQMNLKGFVLGNGVADRHLELNSEIPFGHRMSILSDELYESAQIKCKGEYVNVDPKNTECVEVLQAVHKCFEDLNLEDILEPKCPQFFSEENVLQLPFQIPKRLCRGYYFTYAKVWANDIRVRKALGIHQGPEFEWILCNDHLNFTLDNRFTVVHYHQQFTKLALRALVFSGDHDRGISHVSTEAWLKTLNLPIDTIWHPWLVNGQIAGYTQVYSNTSSMYSLTYATVKGAGHVAAMYFPQEVFTMAKKWFAGQPL